MHKLSFLLITFVFLIYANLLPQSEIFYKIDKYDSEDGLSQNSIFCIHQDRKGFLWFGTENGLNKFDGYHFSNIYFFDTKNDSESVNASWIYDIAEDKNGKLWLANRYGTSCFNLKDNSARHVFFDTLARQGIVFYSITYDNDSLVYLSSTSACFISVNIYNFNVKFFTIPPEFAKRPEFSLYKVIYDSVSKNLYFGTNVTSVLIYNTQTGIFDEILLPQKKFYDMIRYIDIDYEKNYLWIGSYEQGLFCYDLKNKKFIDLNNFISDNINTKAAFKIPIRSLKAYKEKLFIGTYETGLYVLDLENKTFYSLNQIINPLSLKKIGDRINYITIDKSENIWIGEYLSGITKLSENPFHHIGNTPEEKLSLSKTGVWCFYENDQGDLLVGSQKGLYVYDKKLNLKKVINKENTYKDYAINNIFDVKQDKTDASYWIVLNNGLAKLNNDFKLLSYYDQLNNKLQEPYPSCLLIASDNNIYVAGDQYFSKYNRTKDKFEILFENSKVRFVDPNYLFEDSQQRIFIATSYSGFYIYDPKKETLINYSSNVKNSKFQSNEVYYFFEEEPGVFWIAASNGLHKFIEKQNLFIYNSFETGYITELIYCILSDNDNNLWLSTNNGILKFNAKSGNLTRFIKSDGLPSNEFNSNAALKLTNGKMVFGTTNGPLIFDPSKVKTNQYIPPVYLTNIEIDGKRYESKLNFEYITEITLTPDNKIIALEFAALDFTNPHKNQYKYLLEGFDINWKFSAKRIAIFTNLEPKTYILKVAASNNHNLWNNDGLAIKIVQLPPFYKTFWFRALVIIFVLISFYAVLKVRENFLEKKNKELQKINQLLNVEIAERKALENKLIESESKLRSIFENVKSLIFILKDNKIIFQNSFCKSTLKYSNEELGNINFSQILILNDEIENSLKGLYEGKIDTVKFESKAITKDQKEIWLEISATAFTEYSPFDDLTNQKYILCSATDISQRKEIEENLKRAKELAEKSNLLKLNFLAQISHEIRTPLNSIISFSELLNTDLKDYLSDEYKMALESIARSSKRIYRTVDLILNTSEIQIGSYEIKKSKFKLYPDLIEYAVNEVIDEAKSKNLYFTIKSKFSLIWITADFHSTFNIFYHLLDNAIKYTEKGKVEILIDKTQNNKILISIIDTGIGMSESYIQKLFTPFSQEQEGYTRKFDGVGLGLSLVKSYCDFNNFELQITSHKGKGTKVDIYIKNSEEIAELDNYNIVDLNNITENKNI